MVMQQQPNWLQSILARFRRQPKQPWVYKPVDAIKDLGVTPTAPLNVPAVSDGVTAPQPPVQPKKMTLRELLENKPTGQSSLGYGLPSGEFNKWQGTPESLLKSGEKLNTETPGRVYIEKTPKSRVIGGMWRTSPKPGDVQWIDATGNIYYGTETERKAADVIDKVANAAGIATLLYGGWKGFGQPVFNRAAAASALREEAAARGTVLPKETLNNAVDYLQNSVKPNALTKMGITRAIKGGQIGGGNPGALVPGEEPLPPIVPNQESIQAGESAAKIVPPIVNAAQSALTAKDNLSRKTAKESLAKSGLMNYDDVMSIANKTAPSEVSKVQQVADALIDYAVVSSGKASTLLIKDLAGRLAEAVKNHMSALQGRAADPNDKNARKSQELIDRLQPVLKGLQASKRDSNVAGIEALMSMTHRVEKTLLPQIFGLSKPTAENVGLGVNTDIPKMVEQLTSGILNGLAAQVGEPGAFQWQEPKVSVAKTVAKEFAAGVQHGKYADAELDQLIPKGSETQAITPKIYPGEFATAADIPDKPFQTGQPTVFTVYRGTKGNFGELTIDSSNPLIVEQTDKGLGKYLNSLYTRAETRLSGEGIKTYTNEWYNKRADYVKDALVKKGYDALAVLRPEGYYEVSDLVGGGITKKVTRFDIAEEKAVQDSMKAALNPTAEEEKALLNLDETGSELLSSEDVLSTVQNITDYINSPNPEIGYRLTTLFRKVARSIKAQNATRKMDEAAAQGKTPEQSIWIGAKELAGKLPVATSDVVNKASDAVRQAMFGTIKQKVGNYYEMLAESQALAKLLAPEGEVVTPAELRRLREVFGTSITKRLEDRVTAKSKTPLQDVVEGIYHEVDKPELYPEVDQVGADYVRSLGTYASQETLGVEIPGEASGKLTYNPTGQLEMNLGGEQKALGGKPYVSPPTVSDSRTAAELALAKTRLELDQQLLEKKITQDVHDLELKIAQNKAMPYKTVEQAEFPEIDPATAKALSLWPEDTMSKVIRVLKEIAWSPVDIGGFLKSMKSSVDMSYWRQIMPFIPGHPIAFANSNVDAWSGAFSRKAYEELHKSIIHSKYYSIYDALQKKQGRDFLRPWEIAGMSGEKGMEELGYLNDLRLIPRLTSRIPWVKVSNRGFVAGTNSLTWDLFTQFVDNQMRIAEMYAAGLLKSKEFQSFNMTKNIDAYATMLADWTGRASLGRLAPAAPIIGNLLYAPRYALGRLISPRHLFSANQYVRRQAWKDASAFIGVIGGTVIAGQKLGFWDVDTDRSSSDFGKMRVGNVRFDPWGGTQQFFTFFSRMYDSFGSAITRKPLTIPSSVTGESSPTDFTSLIESFAKSKQAPLAGLIQEAMTGKTYSKEDVDPKNIKQWADRIAPMVVMDMWDSIQDKTVPTGLSALSSVASFEGVGVQTYQTFKDWKPDFDKYLEIPSDDQERRAKKMPLSRPQFLDKNPDINAKLFVSGQITSLSTRQSVQNVIDLMNEKGIDPQTIKGITARQNQLDKQKQLNVQGTTTYVDVLLRELENLKQ